MIEPNFPTDLPAILNRINNLDVLAYCQNRNYIDGNVSYLSPYISRGVISTKHVLELIAEKNYEFHEIEIFIKELLWRDYFQRVWQHCNIDSDIKSKQMNVLSIQMPHAISHACTGIEAIDQGIQTLYKTGYMHNHMRMYLSSFACNTLRFHWNTPAKWMYYHLLDADWASNACSWQWVSGSFSANKYFANQDNINKFTHTEQKGTLLDVDYDAIEHVIPSNELLHSHLLDLKTELPESNQISYDPKLPTYLYNFYNLDPSWHQETSGNRILLLEPSVFEQYPVSKSSINFILELGKNIPHLQVFVGNFDEFYTKYRPITYFHKEHPLAAYYGGVREQRDWICAERDEYYPSFFQYWKKCEEHIQKEYFS